METQSSTIGIVYHGRQKSAISCAEELDARARLAGYEVWRAAAADGAEIKKRSCNSKLILSVGGDGTLLRAAKGMAGCQAPIIGVNLGKLGFMTEITADEIFDRLPSLFAGDGWIDTRAMVQAEISSRQGTWTALNDIVVGRGSTCRMIRVEARINGEVLTTYRADGVIVATATGSTSYSLASGGPIVFPQSRDLLLQPISPHLTLSRCLVLPPEAKIELTVVTDRPATLSVDGQTDVPLANEDKVTVRLSDRSVKFLRLHPPEFFYASLMKKLRGEPVC